MLDEPLKPYRIGQEVPLPAAALAFGGRAFVTIDGVVTTLRQVTASTDLGAYGQRRSLELSADPRIIARPPSGRDYTLAEAEALMLRDKSISLVVGGPDTVEGVLRTTISRSGGGLVAAHDRWVVEGPIDPNSRSAYEHKFLTKALHLGGCVDGVNLKNTNMGEYMVRRKQLLEEAHRHDPARPCFDGAHHFMGEEDERGGAQVEPTLRAHVAARLSAEAAIDKERRKARESAGPAAGGKPPDGKKK